MQTVAGVTVSERITDNRVASDACLGAAGLGRLGVVVKVEEEGEGGGGVVSGGR